jgi:1,4-dihydroxy-2-naphthoyl-CoA hydrolase
MTIWKPHASLEAMNQRSHGSMISHLGIEFTEIGPDFLRAKMPVDHRTLQPVGILHGGASAALSETVGSVAGHFCIDLEKYFCVGLEVNINHLRQISSGFVIATAKPFHIGRKTHVWSIEVRDEQGRLVAISRHTLAVLPRE